MTPRQLAIAAGENVYNSKPCIRCGNLERYTCSRECVHCRKSYDASPTRRKARKLYLETPKGKAILKKSQDAYCKTSEGIVSQLLKSAKYRAKKKKIPFDIKSEWLLPKIEKGVCEITGRKFDTKSLKGKRHNPYAPSLDQISPKLGYTEENVQVICRQVNIAKGEMSMSEFLDFCRFLNNTIVEKHNEISSLG